MSLQDLLLSATISIALTYLVITRDRIAHKSPGGWNPATTAAAILFFAPLCLIAYFWVSRRRWARFALGPLWLVAVTVIQAALLGTADRFGIGYLALLMALSGAALPLLLTLTIVWLGS